MDTKKAEMPKWVKMQITYFDPKTCNVGDPAEVIFMWFWIILPSPGGC